MTSSTLSRFPEERYCLVLAAAARDLEGRRWPAGTAVLANPVQPEEFLVDTPGHRSRFADSGFAWSDGCRQRLLDEALDRLAGSASFAAAVQVREGYLAALHANLTSAVGAPFPYAKVPLRAFVLPWHPRVRRVGVANLDRQLVEVLAERTLPEGWRHSERVRQMLGEVTACRLYELRGLCATTHVLVAFTVTFDPDACAVIGTPTPLELAQRALGDDHELDPPSLWCAIGSVGDVPPAEVPQARVAYATPDARGGWSTVAAAAPWPRGYIQSFAQRLLPVTREERTAQVKAVVDRHFASGMVRQVDNVRVRDVLHELPGMDRASVREAMVELQAADYAVRRGAEGEFEIRPRHLPGDRVLAPTHVRCGWARWQRVALSMLPPTILLVSFTFRDWWIRGVFQWTWFLLALPICIVTAWIVNWVEGIPRRDR